MRDETKWKFVTNTKKSTLQHVLMCCEYAGLRAEFDDTATDIFGNKLEDALEMYIPVEQVDTMESETFWTVFGMLSVAYKKLLFKKGIATDADIPYACYLGTEKELGLDISGIKDMSIEEITKVIQEDWQKR